MAFFYLLLAAAILLLLLTPVPAVAWTFAGVFGFALGADYMLIPLLTADCFGLSSLGTVLALIISGYTVGQWIAPWLAGHIYDVYHSYRFAWLIMALAGMSGAAIIYMVAPSQESPVAVNETSVSAEVV